MSGAVDVHMRCHWYIPERIKKRELWRWLIVPGATLLLLLHHLLHTHIELHKVRIHKERVDIWYIRIATVALVIIAWCWILILKRVNIAWCMHIYFRCNIHSGQKRVLLHHLVRQMG